MEALQQARRDRAAAAIVIEEIGEPGPAVNGGSGSGVVLAAPIPAPATTVGAALSFGENTVSDDAAAPASVSRKRKPFSDAAESGAGCANKRMHIAPQISEDAMEDA